MSPRRNRGSILIVIETVGVALLLIGFLLAVEIVSTKPPEAGTTIGKPQATSTTPTFRAAPKAAPLIEPYQSKTLSNNSIIFTGSGFVPSKLEVWPSNRKVYFKNQSKVNMWIASDPHPTHSGLPGFNQGVALPPGGIYTYTFPAGTALYGFHNHLNPAQRGTIVVK